MKDLYKVTTKSIQALGLLTFILFSSACGQTGALYLPETPEEEKQEKES